MRSPEPRSERPSPRREAPGAWRRLAVAALVALAVIVVELRFGDTGGLRSLELQTLDWRFRWRGPLAPGPETVLIMIDDRTVAELGVWPLPRPVIAVALRRLAEAQARVIALDLLFAEAQAPLSADVRSLLAALVAKLPPDAPELRRRAEAALTRGGDDLDLAQAIHAGGRVITPYAFVLDARQANTAGVPPWIRDTAYRVRTGGDAAADAALAPAGLLVPAAQLASAGVSTGHVTLVLEPDGTLRTALPAVAFAGELFPSLPVEAARHFLGLEPERLAVQDNTALRIGELRVPLDPALRHVVNHYGPQGTIPTYSLIDLLRGQIEPALLAGRIVVVGAAAAGAGDRFATPFTARLPGAEFLGTAIDNMLHQRALVRDESTRALDLVAVILLATATAFLAGRRAPAISLLAMLSCLAAWAVLSQLAFARHQLWLAGVAPSVAAIAAGVGVEALRLAHERRRRRGLERQRANLGRYFPPSVVERLAASDAPRGLDRTHEATVMFVDLLGFTRTAETMSPEAAMGLLRGFHTLVEGIVFAHHGMVDKFMGDGVMACFGVPDPSPAAEADALRAAFELLAALARPIAADADGEVHTLAVGIGIHRGPVLMGDVGGATQLQFTVVGDAVNVASRLEALTRSVGTPLIASDAVVAAARPRLEAPLLARLERLPDTVLRGRREPVAIWRLAAQR